jgi:hypothetical protein
MSSDADLNRLHGLKVRAGTRIWPGVSLRPLFAVMIACAMLFAPLVMQSGSAMAAMPSDHQSQMIGKDHCEGQPTNDRDSKSAEKPCCAAMCAAVAIAAGSPVEPAVFARAVERPAVEQFRHGFLAKLPTPPPRLA